MHNTHTYHIIDCCILQKQCPKKHIKMLHDKVKVTDSEVIKCHISYNNICQGHNGKLEINNW